ncbi:MAG TPA: sulfite exporter TauE/SafE family protein [Gammaproteobacteria bacterium]|nr:sulfite exporter TauE/SafE family protein [Gammaproteobacteria bacterium]
MSALLWPAAFAMGIVLGMFGAGGGMLTVPLLIYLAHVPIKAAVAMSLWVVALVSLAALAQQRAWHCLQPRLLLVFGLTGVAGSVTGSTLAPYLPERLQLGLFAALTLLVAWWLNKLELSNRVSVFRFIPASITGFAIGALTGIVGVGGGFLLVPALIYLGIGHFPTAVAHSLLLVCFNALAGGITYLNTESFSLPLTLILAALAAVGSTVGGFLLKRLPSTQLQRGFNIMLVLLGSFMLWRAIAT